MILLDTHAFVWWASDRSQLSKHAQATIQNKTDSILISVASAWEIALLHKKKRLRLPLPPDEFINRSLEHHGIRELPITRKIAITAVNLPDLHNDPFDRILIAEAKQNNFTIVTKDSIIPNYPGVKIAW